MHHIVLDSETDFEGWRQAARALALNDIAPADVRWTRAQGDADLFAPERSELPEAGGTFNVPADFVALCKEVILHRSPERFSLLYRLLWRLRQNHDLLAIASDPDVAQAHAMARAVRRDIHKMHAFVRFREFGREREMRYIAWFEPEHHIVETAAPFFAARFADMPWSILTPDRCAHWDGHAILYTEGAAKNKAPASDPLEDIWRSYYASIFNPARLKVKAMQAEMPKKYWRNLPEASLIDPLIAQAQTRTSDMIAAAPSSPNRRRQREEAKSRPRPSDTSLSRLRAEAEHCRACPLWADATQIVFGEGAAHAPLMLVGEQPGDKEDLAGRPFVGPAGQMLDRALADAGVDRDKAYVTNAVKHFKFVPRGKIRLHQKPNTAEIRACRPWYERELALIRPALVIAMGATAAQSVFGKITPIGKMRGRLIELDDRTQALVTVHPSYLLRLPDEAAKAAEYERFVADLKIAAEFLAGYTRAAQAS